MEEYKKSAYVKELANTNRMGKVLETAITYPLMLLVIGEAP
jgi:hypothetical protein